MRGGERPATLGPMVAAEQSTANPPRVRSRALTAFLLVVAVAVGISLWQSHPMPDLDGGLRLLADGDLDGVERDRMLRRVLQQAAGESSVRARWAGVVAAVALGDEQALATTRARLGDGAMPLPVPGPAERHDLDLGDALVRAALFAWIAEASGDPATAKARWSSVGDQALLSRRPFAHALAMAELRRLK